MPHADDLDDTHRRPRQSPGMRRTLWSPPPCRRAEGPARGNRVREQGASDRTTEGAADLQAPEHDRRTPQALIREQLELPPATRAANSLAAAMPEEQTGMTEFRPASELERNLPVTDLKSMR